MAILYPPSGLWPRFRLLVAYPAGDVDKRRQTPERAWLSQKNKLICEVFEVILPTWHQGLVADYWAEFNVGEA